MHMQTGPASSTELEHHQRIRLPDVIMVKLPLVQSAPPKESRRIKPGAAGWGVGRHIMPDDAIIVKEPLVMSEQPKERERRYIPADVKGSISASDPPTPSS